MPRDTKSHHPNKLINGKQFIVILNGLIQPFVIFAVKVKRFGDVLRLFRRKVFTDDPVGDFSA